MQLLQALPATAVVPQTAFVIAPFRTQMPVASTQPVQDTQVFVVASQAGVVVPAQAAVFPARHCTQVLLEVSQTGAASVVQLPSPMQATQVPALAPVSAQIGVVEPHALHALVLEAAGPQAASVIEATGIHRPLEMQPPVQSVQMLLTQVVPGLPAQWLNCVHSTQAPAAQYGVAEMPAQLAQVAPPLPHKAATVPGSQMFRSVPVRQPAQVVATPPVLVDVVGETAAQ